MERNNNGFEGILLEEIRLNRREINKLNLLVHQENTDVRRELSSFKIKITSFFTVFSVVANIVFEIWRKK